MIEKVYFSLGSNLGDREANLREALRRMDESFDCHYQAISSFIETKAWGFIGDKFINCAVLYFLSEEPMEVLAKCKAIERDMGRTDIPEFDAEGKRIYHSRIIDIDILLFGDRVMDTEQLTIPHPRMEEREFVQLTLKEIR